MNSRWTARIVGIILIIFFLMLLANLQKRLIEMQHLQEGTPTSTR